MPSPPSFPPTAEQAIAESIYENGPFSEMHTRNQGSDRMTYTAWSGLEENHHARRQAIRRAEKAVHALAEAGYVIVKRPSGDQVEAVAKELWRWNEGFVHGHEPYPYERLIEPTKDDLREVAGRILAALSRPADREQVTVTRAGPPGWREQVSLPDGSVPSRPDPASLVPEEIPGAAVEAAAHWMAAVLQGPERNRYVPSDSHPLMGFEMGDRDFTRGVLQAALPHLLAEEREKREQAERELESFREETKAHGWRGKYRI